jgi:ABC-type phosphate transport system permease subunit
MKPKQQYMSIEDETKDRAIYVSIFALTIIGIFSILGGFHNIDLSRNQQLVIAEYNTILAGQGLPQQEYHEIALSGKRASYTTVYINGIRMLFGGVIALLIAIFIALYMKN